MWVHLIPDLVAGGKRRLRRRQRRRQRRLRLRPNAASVRGGRVAWTARRRRLAELHSVRPDCRAARLAAVAKFCWPFETAAREKREFGARGLAAALALRRRLGAGDGAAGCLHPAEVTRVDGVGADGLVRRATCAASSGWFAGRVGRVGRIGRMIRELLEKQVADVELMLLSGGGARTLPRPLVTSEASDGRSSFAAIVLRAGRLRSLRWF